MITINEFMTAGPCTLRASDTIGDAIKIMTERHIRHIPITDDENHVLGLVTQRDVLAVTEPTFLSSEQTELTEVRSKLQLSEIMIKDVSVVHQSDSLRQAALYLQTHKYGCLPVVFDDCLVGIITDSDFIAIAINLLEQAELSEDIVEIEEESAVDVVDSLAVDETQ